MLRAPVVARLGGLTMFCFLSCKGTDGPHVYVAAPSGYLSGAWITDAVNDSVAIRLVLTHTGAVLTGTGIANVGMTAYSGVVAGSVDTIQGSMSAVLNTGIRTFSVSSMGVNKYGFQGTLDGINVKIYPGTVASTGGRVTGLPDTGWISVSAPGTLWSSFDGYLSRASCAACIVNSGSVEDEAVSTFNYGYYPGLAPINLRIRDPSMARIGYGPYGLGSDSLIGTTVGHTWLVAYSWPETAADSTYIKIVP